MLLLILITDRMSRAAPLATATRSGILYWGAIYVPVAVAIAASQNVRAAVSGGPAAILAGAVATVACLLLVPVVSRIGGPDAHGCMDGLQPADAGEDRSP